MPEGAGGRWNLTELPLAEYEHVVLRDLDSSLSKSTQTCIPLAYCLWAEPIPLLVSINLISYKVKSSLEYVTYMPYTASLPGK